MYILDLPNPKNKVSESESPQKWMLLAGIGRKSQSQVRQAIPAGLDPEAQLCGAALPSPRYCKGGALPPVGSAAWTLSLLSKALRAIAQCLTLMLGTSRICLLP